MTRPEYLKQAKQMLESHPWGHFTIAQGGSGVIAVGCECCKIRLNTVPQYLQHLAEDVLPRIIEEVLERTAIEES